mmetsp:Transcript_4808/g.8645  ORF Transcript_4808/g.8645 Transcript_4808/m.8645 type:complete len:133 (+) Transcript_4808:58-456(+)|eukprot:CAMPEP_0201601060 /NCGR_PEP_ID=MMETSP0492-20130828/2075_1 /ASSEMBLY_ACC=CAM_ASM_000837 /TAXON_ID=420259 /ORGANISM="Thalassiosira gravida, Strain GMp14c1" /LENGTH=132 /DNA_ID=CAMNT_0048064129 /DNA_START=67 /DNA_END=465 /DNA_ORIENTATION=+
MTNAAILLLAIACSFNAATSFSTSPHTTTRGTSELFAGGWGNNQERSVSNEEVGGVNGSPIYDAYAIEDRGEFMQRVKAERRMMRNKKAADLLEVARIAGVELKKKEVDPEKLDMFDVDDISSDDEYLDVSI